MKILRGKSMKRFMPVLFSSVLCVFFLGAAWAEQHVIRILHMNDFHGFAEPYEPSGSNRLIGGIAFLAAKVGRLRSEKNSLLLAAGDMIRGNNWSDTSRGRSVIELMNAMKFDAMVLGNHEFDFGQEELKKKITEAKFPVLGANVEGMGPLKQYVLKEMGGTRVAIIGVVTEYTPESTHARNVAGLKFSPPADTLRGYMRELKDRVDIIVVLSHCGYSEDRLLADQVRGIDVIVGGHSHTKLEKPVRVNGTIIVQAWEHGKALGVLDLTVRDGKIVEYAGHLEEIMPVADLEDKTVGKIVEQYRDKGDKAANEVIGAATVDFEAENVRRQGTNLGDLIADIMRQVSGADAAIINGGGIRATIRKGEIRTKDVYAVLPFDSYIVAIKLSGRLIIETLEHGVSAVEQEEGRFPQVSGLAFAYSASSPPGSRVREILINGEPLDPNREYIVATNDFMAAGGDGYTTFGKAVSAPGDDVTKGKVVFSDSGRWLRDVVVEYIRERHVLSAPSMGRIKKVH